ncbi:MULTISPECIES: class I SAM-dependent methyltransferase [Nocardia]|uniref:class I SAM-dependent methyltransferase n=1 Tax=Nocardia TaxID=1817 RepID=UPI000D68F121|nr:MULTISPECIES: class I SAM-dependent methyltransferase [Nocardia]
MTSAHPHHSAAHVADSAVHAEILDLDAEILADHTVAVISWLPIAAAPREILDLGCGTGAGTFALLARFPTSRVTAVDSSVEHLHRLHRKACADGVQERVRTIRADLDATEWPDPGTPDLVWASASMHHMAHPDRVLRKVRDVLAPGGLFAVVELAGMPRFLPETAPDDRPGLENRCHAAADDLHAQHMPHRGADWGPMLTAAGFTVEGVRTLAVDVDGASNAAIGRYALGTLRRLRHAVADTLAPEDLAALDRLLDTDSPHSLLHRTDLALRTERTVWAARRN